MNFNVQDGNKSDFVSKILQPGTQMVRIVKMELDAPPYKPEAYFVNLTLEGEDLGADFEGVLLDKNNPSLGSYKGQMATVKSGRYPFSTFEWKNKTIERDEQIFRFINNLAKQMGVFEKMCSDGMIADNIEEYVALAATYLTKPELWGKFTIAGQEYFNEGYSFPNYRLFFPKSERGKYPFSAIKDDEGNYKGLVSFDEATHILKAVEKKDKEDGGDTKEDNKAVGTFDGNAPSTKAKEDGDDLPF